MRKIKKLNKEDKLLEKFLKLIVKLPHEQYFGIVRILNVDFTEKMGIEEIRKEINELEEEIKRIKDAEENVEDSVEENIEDSVEDNVEENVEEEKIEDTNTYVAADGMKNGDMVETEHEDSAVIEVKDAVGAPNVRTNPTQLEAMEKRLEKLREEENKEENEITIQKFRTGEAIMLDTIDKFSKLSNTKKKNLLAILKAGAY